MLNTPQAVINAAGALPPDYYGLVPLVGSIGFSVKRHYPANSPFAGLLTGGGQPNYICVVKFSVEPPTIASGISKVWVSADFYPEWEATHRWGQYDFNDPPCPTPAAVQGFSTAPRPVDLEFTDEFVYDNGDGRFYSADGPVTGAQVVDFVFAYHCRTLNRRFRVRYRLVSAVLEAVHRLVWRGHDGCIWLLQTGYGVRVREERRAGLRDLLRQYNFGDFTRSDDGDTHFFGFRSSKSSLASNLVVLAIGCFAVYRLVPHTGFLRAIYNNAALTTAALVLGFLVADQVVTLMLKLMVIGLARLKPRTVFIVRRVRA